MNSHMNNRPKRRALVILLMVLLALLTLVGAFRLGQLSAGESLPRELVKPSASPKFEETIKPSPEVTLPVEIYADCDAVWDELGRPITREDDGFPEPSPNKFDLDADGIGCEDDPNTSDVDESKTDWESIWIRTKENGENFGDYVKPKLKDFWEDYGNPAVDTLESQLSKLFE